MILETVVVGALEVNCYILAVKEDSAAIIIDPGDQYRLIKEVLDKRRLKPGLVANTHGHYDHIGCDDKFGVPVYIHAKDERMLKDPMLNLSGVFSLGHKVNSEVRCVEDNSIIELGGISLKVLHIPGHTLGGMALLLQAPQNKVVFTGDTLFAGGIGRSDLAGGNEAALIKGIKQKLLSLPADTAVYPGHGPSTTVAEEIKNNPFLS